MYSTEEITSKLPLWQLAEIDALILRNEWITAIKEVRSILGCGLKEAKDWVVDYREPCLRTTHSGDFVIGPRAKYTKLTSRSAVARTDMRCALEEIRRRLASPTLTGASAAVAGECANIDRIANYALKQ